MIRKITHYVDLLMTEEMARERLNADKVDVSWYTNKTNRESVLHSHPYYEAILPISGEVLYSVNGSLYHLHTGELIVFPDEVFHSGKFDVGADVSERLLLKVDAELWQTTAEIIGFPNIFSAKEPIIFSAETVSAWDLRGLFMRISRTSTMDKSLRMLEHGEADEKKKADMDLMYLHMDLDAKVSNWIKDMENILSQIDLCFEGELQIHVMQYLNSLREYIRVFRKGSSDSEIRDNSKLKEAISLIHINEVQQKMKEQIILIDNAMRP